ncbi:MAG: AraC family transcriptional regulator [Pseudomonadota bacterium]
MKYQKTALPSGGGAFRLEETTLGVFLDDQPTHRLAMGSDKVDVIPLTAQQGWIMPAGAEGLCEFDRPLDFLTISFGADVLRDLGVSDISTLAPQVGDLDPVLLSMALQADKFDTGGTLYRETMHRAMAAQLVQAIAPPSDAAAPLEDQRLARVVDYIKDNIAADLSIDTMAGIAAMSPSHFAKSFKAATGASPLQYVISERLTLAGVLLKSTKLPVAEIAYRVGYNDLSRFGQHFKRHYKTTPANHRG